eukprot:jgi/Ulvmu1/10067/UM006_0014.1
MQAQRAGERTADSLALFLEVWAWKESGYTSMCADFVATLTPEEQQQVNLQSAPGYFEAENAVLATAPTRFVTTQVAIGALQFMPAIAAMMPGDAFGDPAGCLSGGYAEMSHQELLLRQMRYMAATLSTAVVVSAEDNSKFVLLVGVADSSTYGSTPYPSWATPPPPPPDDQQKCYIADLDHPAADVAAQAAAGLAMHGTVADAALADGLYRNEKDAREFLFVAAAALYTLTGDPGYRADVDALWQDGWAKCQLFLNNWNNVITQGLTILSMVPEAPGARRSRGFYRGLLRSSVGQWSECSNGGAATMKRKQFCGCVPCSTCHAV